MTDEHSTEATPCAGTGSDLPQTWEMTLAWLLRATIGGTAVYHLATAQWLYVLLCLLGIAVMLAVPLYARSMRASLPFELELVLLWWLVGDMTLGRLANLYSSSAWFDKALHLLNPMLLSWLAFLALYALYLTGRLRVSAPLLIGATLLLTLGLGALWEIGEYASDLWFGRGAQGSPVMAPLDDTMIDLVFDGVGGLVGGMIGALYVRYSVRSHCRLRGISRLIP